MTTVGAEPEKVAHREEYVVPTRKSLHHLEEKNGGGKHITRPTADYHPTTIVEDAAVIVMLVVD